MRHACRALLVDERDHFLLAEHVIGGGTVWAAVGGGVEEGETLMAALARELREETGCELDQESLADMVEVWTQSAGVPEVMGLGWSGVTNHYFWVRVDHFDPVPGVSPGQPGSHESDGIMALRWWSIEEIAGCTGEPGVLFSPRRLAALLADLLAAEAAGQLPEEPLRLGL